MDYDEVIASVRKERKIFVNTPVGDTLGVAFDAIVQLHARVAELDETWTDELGTVWKSPTAWAYAMTCRARQTQQDRAERAESVLAAARARNQECDLLLSRVLHELAGAASLCWEPKPAGVFDSQQAIGFVEAAIQELRSALAGKDAP
jgi:prolyl-tRNA synthetase